MNGQLLANVSNKKMWRMFVLILQISFIFELFQKLLVQKNLWNSTFSLISSSDLIQSSQKCLTLYFQCSKMVRHTLKILQHLLQHFQSVSVHFTTFRSKGLTILIWRSNKYTTLGIDTVIVNRCFTEKTSNRYFLLFRISSTYNNRKRKFTGINLIKINYHIY